MTELQTTFSVIVPLEFHRGQAERCLREWSRNQTYPRSLYELVVVAPDDFPPRRLENLRSSLTGRDRLLLRPERHDMALVVKGAEVATGEILFFTESHCWPDPNVLEKTAGALRAHPDWVGLSCRSIPVTHNPLSVVEADMYRADIDFAMLHLSWRKVLDQGFAVRRDPYFRSGGFDAEMGHFAEWMMGARLAQMGMAVGYLPEARIHHFYVGQISDVKKFTQDFTDGQMRALARQPRDPCASVFPETPEWSERHNWRRPLAMRMVKLLWKDRLRATNEDGAKANRDVGWSHLARWVPAALAGAVPAWLVALVRASCMRCRLWWTVRFAREGKLSAVLLTYCAALIRARRLRFLVNRPWMDGASLEGRGSGDQPDAGEWEPGRGVDLQAVGFHLAEAWRGTPFRWSEPAAIVELPLPAGTISVTIEWLPVRTWEQPPGMRLYFNERPVSGKRTSWDQDRVTVSLEVSGGGACRLAWVCRPFLSPGDARALGLPLRRLAWRREVNLQPRAGPGGSSRFPAVAQEGHRSAVEAPKEVL